MPSKGATQNCCVSIPSFLACRRPSFLHMAQALRVDQLESPEAEHTDGATTAVFRQPGFPWRLRIALLVSLLVHALFLSLSLGSDAFGLPGLRFPWEERRLAAHELNVVLAKAPAAGPEAAPAAEPLPAVVREAPPAPPAPAPIAPQIAAPVTPAPEAPRLAVEKPVAAVADQAAHTQVEQEAARVAQQRQDAVRAAEAAKREAARVEEERLALARQESQRQETVRQEQEQAEAARVEAARREQVRQAQLEAEQRERLEQSRLAELARQEATRQEALRQEQLKQAQREAAQRETVRQEQAKQEQARQEQAKQEQARQEQARQEQARQEQARQEQAKQDSARQAQLQAQRERAEQEAKREERLRAIGRQLDQEAAARDAPNRPAASGLRRGWSFGRGDPNADLLQYAQAMARKIELNMTIDMVRDALKQPHVRPVVTVAVRADGSVEKVSFVTSSGVPALDEAVRKVIASQAPYGAFPPALARQYDVIEFRRTWVFDVAIRLE